VQYFTRLADWQADLTNDVHSLSHDPRVASAAAGDFHLISAGGRVRPDGTLTNDPAGQYSPLLDTGNPAAAFTNESSPNGGRINIGAYGNTAQASRSRTNGWLLALSYNDGAEISKTNRIYWAAGGWNSNELVRIEFAGNGTDFNTVVASNLPVYQDGYAWNVSEYPTQPLTRWRVVSQTDTSVFSAVESTIAIKNEPLVIYVNDNSPSNDVYTTATGSSLNDGLSPSAPLRSPADALERYPLGAGDVVFIDTGHYVINETDGMRVGLFGDFLKSGAVGRPLSIVGSTNASGTRIQGKASTGYGLWIYATRHIAVSNITFTGVTNGILVTDSDSITFRGVGATANQTGFKISNTPNVSFRHSAAWSNSLYGLSTESGATVVDWAQGVLAENTVAGAYHLSGTLSVSNSIITATASNSLIYQLNQAATIRADHNVYWPRTNPFMMRPASGAGTSYADLRTWQRDRGVDAHSLRIDPLFANLAAGDFRLKSDNGRPVGGSTSLVFDTETSWAIDAGNPGADFSNEPLPNGSRMDAGQYGNTENASRSTTNPAVLAMTLSDGGLASNPQDLRWLVRGLDSNATIRLEHTGNDGLGWSMVATNIPAGLGVYSWNNGSVASSPLNRWRIIVEGQTNIYDESDSPFYVRNSPIFYYVNDSNTADDVYTTTAGSDLNNGITVSSPVFSVRRILDRYDLDEGDTIFVDTGVYNMNTNTVLSADDSGSSTSRVRIIGSTNVMAGGTIFTRRQDNAVSALENIQSSAAASDPQAAARSLRASARASRAAYATDSILVKFKSGASVRTKQALHAARSTRTLRSFEALRTDVVKLPSGQSVIEAIAAY